MSKPKLNPVVRDQIVARLRQGDKPHGIASEMGVGLSTVYAIRLAEFGKVDANTLGVPLDGADPTLFGKRVGIQLSGDDMAALSPRSEAIVVAAMVSQDSLKSRLLRAIVEQGPFADVLTLMAAVRNGPKDTFGSHEVTHILKASLAKQGLIKYTESRNLGATGGGSVPTKIQATERGYEVVGYAAPGKSPEGKHGQRPAGWSRKRHAVGRDYTEARNHGRTAVAVSTMTVQRPVSNAAWQPDGVATGTVNVPDVREALLPEPVAVAAAPVSAASYPLLTALWDSFLARAEADAKASRYADAAALLEQDDPDEAARLLDKALALAPATLTELEREYLRFAEAHGAKPER